MSANPPDVTALLIRGAREAINLGNFDVAGTLCEEGLKFAPGDAGLTLLLGRVKFIQKDFKAAKSLLTEALKANSNEAFGWLLLGRAHEKFQEWTQAVAAFETAFALKPATAAEEAELGHYYGNKGDAFSAAACFMRALALDPKNAAVWNDLGSMQIELGEMPSAKQSFDKALALEPGALAPLRNLALWHEMMGDAEAALTVHDQIVTLKPADAASRQKRGATRLAHGRLGEGWIDYRARFVNPEHKGWHGGIPKPRWEDGLAPLKEKSVLIWSDQGLGDQILVAGLLRETIAAAKRVVFACEPRLIPLIERSFPGLRVVSLMDISFGKVNLDDVDVQASISEIGPLLRPEFTAFPNHDGYLKADPAKVKELKTRYTALPGEGPIVGLSWHSTNVLAAGHKSVGLDQWSPILKTPGVRFVSLQYGEAVNAAKGTHIYVDPYVDPMADVDLFAAQVAAMDMVVSTSNTTVHMAGALNVPTICLTPMVEGRPWYWFVGRDTSPWYPSVRHIWQTKRRTWDDVIARAAAELAKRA